MAVEPITRSAHPQEVVVQTCFYTQSAHIKDFVHRQKSRVVDSGYALSFHHLLCLALTRASVRSVYTDAHQGHCAVHLREGRGVLVSGAPSRFLPILSGVIHTYYPMQLLPRNLLFRLTWRGSKRLYQSKCGPISLGRQSRAFRR